jgi:predicted ATPase
MAYGTLADLLKTVETAVLSALPGPQRHAINRILLRSDDDGPGIEPRAVAAAVLSIAEAVAISTPVLIAIDDVQWVDSSSAFALSFAFRRLSGRVGVLGTLRAEPSAYDAASWLQMPKPHTLQRITVPPFDISEISELLAHRHRRVFSRWAISRIHQVSRGNPF